MNSISSSSSSSSSSPSKGAGKKIFVTVGTTRFDELIDAVTSKVVLEWLKRQGFTLMTIQYGRGIKPKFKKCEESSTSFTYNIEIRMYDFRPSLIDDIEKADLILSHAGAGTVMEVLRMKEKKLIVVINTKLMDNHQVELATAMAERGHLFVVDRPEKLHQVETLESFENFVPFPHQGGDPFDFPILLDSFLGFPQVENNRTDKKTE